MRIYSRINRRAPAMTSPWLLAVWRRTLAATRQRLPGRTKGPDNLAGLLRIFRIFNGISFVVRRISRSLELGSIVSERSSAHEEIVRRHECASNCLELRR